MHTTCVWEAATFCNSSVRVLCYLPAGAPLLQLALWLTEYMGGFGFAAVFETSDRMSYVRTPTDGRISLEHKPYRMLLPCRRPTAQEEMSASPSGAIPVLTPALTSATTTVIGRAAHRLVTVGEAWTSSNLGCILQGAPSLAIPVSPAGRHVPGDEGAPL